MQSRPCTTKQMGDACEMLVAAEMTLKGVPAMKMPDCWPHYDVVAQLPTGELPQRISVKSRTFKLGGSTFVTYKNTDQFDWLAIVLLPGGGESRRRIFVVPRSVADARARTNNPKSKAADERWWRQDEVPKVLAEFENNFKLSVSGLMKPKALPKA